MKLKLILALAIVACLQTGCAGSNELNNVVVAPPKLVLVQPDSKLTDSCNFGVTLPKTEITQSEVESLWSIDRKSLADCREAKDALRDFYKLRDSELMK